MTGGVAGDVEEAPALDRNAIVVAHVLFRLDVGGLEAVLVNLINGLAARRYRHAIICLTAYTQFRERIARPDVKLFALGKRPGKDLRSHLRLWRLLRELKPHIMHTYNIAALDYVLVGTLARVPVRVHAEHGRDVVDLHGTNRKYILMRRILSRLFDRFVPVSRELEGWLIDKVGLAESKVTRICNGVDTGTFRPAAAAREPLPPDGFAPAGSFVIGCVGRIHPVKDHLTLVRAFLHLLDTMPAGRDRLRLVIVGVVRRQERSASCLRPLARPSSHGSPALVTTSLHCFAASMCSSCHRWSRALPSPSSRRWPAHCR